MAKAAVPLGEKDVNIQSSVAKDTKGKPGKEPTQASKKRKSAPDENEMVDNVEIPDGTPMNWDANQIRNKIRTMLSNSDMTVAQMQDKCGVSSNSYYSFMKQSGPNSGTMSDCFYGATMYFKKRELAGLTMPRKKKAKTDDNADQGASNLKTSASKGKKTKAEENKELDVSEVKLDGEDTDSVPIYLTCDDVRTLINAHLRNTSASQASFCRTVESMYTTIPHQGTKTASLKTFLSSSGVLMGASSPIFYGGYVYFEKLRIKQKKPKSKKRKEMEEVWGRQGMEIAYDMKNGILMHVDDMIFTDKYGHVETHRRDWAAPQGWKAYRGR